MTTKLAMALVDEDFSPEAGAVDRAADDAADEIGMMPAPSRIKLAREWADKLLAEMTAKEADLQTKMAAAQAAFEAKTKEAEELCRKTTVEANAQRAETISFLHQQHEFVMSEATAELRQATGLRSALATFQGELRKAEL